MRIQILVCLTYNPKLNFVRQIILLLVLQTQITLLFSQYYETQITKIIDNKGDSPGATFAITEDERGFIWFGTVDGLYRYDGYNFKIFRNIPGDSNSLSNNTIRSLVLAPDNKIWIATQGGGLDYLDIKTEEFKHYIHTGSNDNEISGNFIWSLHLDSKGFLWIGHTGLKLDRLDPKNGKIKHFSIFPYTINFRQEQVIRSITEDHEGKIWVGMSENGLTCLDPWTEKYTYYTNSQYNGLSSNSIYDIHQSNDRRIWLCGFGGGISVFNYMTHNFEVIAKKTNTGNSLNSNLIYSIIERVPNEFWIATEYGVNIFNATNFTFSDFSKNSQSEFSISENRVRKLFVDKNGIIWAGTESGVDKFVIHHKFELYRKQPNQLNSMSDGIVKAIIEDSQSNIWMGLIDNGLVKYDPQKKIFTHYLNNPKDTKSLPANNVNALYQDSKKNIWIGEWNTGLIKYNAKDDNFTKVKFKNIEENHGLNFIQVIREGKPGILWLGAESGLIRFNTHTNEAFLFKHEEDNPNSLSGNAVQSCAMVFDKYNNLWVGTWSFGLNKIEFLDSSETNVKFTHWKNIPGDTTSLSNDNVISLCFDNNGILWIGTFGGGLMQFNPETGEFNSYTTANGLSNNVIYAIINDKNNNLWLSTDYGITMYNTQNKTFQNYYKSDGLQDNHFFWGSAFHGKSGKIYFGGINGMNSFYPEKVEPDVYPTFPIISGLQLFNQPINLNNEGFTESEMVFNYNKNFISFEFSALDFHDPSKNQYKYMLEGFDKNWINNGNKPSATYTNLSPGNYVLKLMVSNSYGMWNPKVLSVSVIILPPWWKTWWASTLFILSGLMLVYFFITLRLKILHKQKKQLEEQVRIRTSELHKNNTQLTQTLDKLEQTKKALVDSEKMAAIGILTAGVAHEINNPLNFIAGSIEVLKSEIDEIADKLGEPGKPVIQNFNKMLNIADTGIERISAITGNLKTFLHKDSGSPEGIPVKKLITSSIELLEQKVPKNIIIELHLNEVPDIIGHKYPLSQVIINIIDNAIDAITEHQPNEKSKIIVSSKQELLNNKEYVLIGIANTGPLIPDTALKNIFDPFFTTKAPKKGTGLGLYLSYNIIKNHNGLIVVDNQNNRVNFKIYLPFVENT